MVFDWALSEVEDELKQHVFLFPNVHWEKNVDQADAVNTDSVREHIKVWATPETGVVDLLQLQESGEPEIKTENQGLQSRCRGHLQETMGAGLPV